MDTQIGEEQDSLNRRMDGIEDWEDFTTPTIDVPTDWQLVILLSLYK